MVTVGEETKGRINAGAPSVLTIVELFKEELEVNKDLYGKECSLKLTLLAIYICPEGCKHL